MKKQTIALLLAGAMLAFFSCKKSSSSPSPAANLESGTWVISKVYVDTIGNGVFSTAALVTDTSFAHEFYQFSSNGVMSYSYYNESSKGTWALLYNNTYLDVVDTTESLAVIGNVITLSSSSIELKDTTGISSGTGSTTWVFFAKN